MKKLRAAVIGVGYLGRFHAQKYKARPDVDLIAVCDGRSDQAQAVAGELQTEALTNPRDLIGRVDLVTIAASTQAHYELGRLFLEAGIPVNLEKPLAATAADAARLVELAEQRKTLLCVGHIERFNPALLSARAELPKPAFLEFVRHTGFRARGADVSVLHDLMIHDLDLLLWWTGGALREVHGLGRRLITSQWDAGEVLIEMDNGVVARVSASRVSSKPQRSLRVMGDKFFIQADLGTLEVQKVEPVAVDAAEPLRVSALAAAKVDALERETDAFVKAVRGEAPPAVSGVDGWRALEAVERVDRLFGGNR